MADMKCDKLLRVGEVATILGCSVSTVWRRCGDDTLPIPLKIGHTTRWLYSEVAEVIEAAKAARR